MSNFLRRITPAVPHVAMLTLAFGSSVGVYRFSLLFFPWYIAGVVAASFELTYLGLAVIRVRLDDGIRQQALWLARSAAGVAMLIVTLDGFFHLRPALLLGKPWYVDLALAFVHGVPLPYIAYRMSNLILHPQDTTANVAPTLRPPRRTIRRRPASMHRTRTPQQEYTPAIMASETQQLYIKEVTDKTLDIVKLWNDGYNKSQIAAQLGGTRQAVQQHLKRASEAGLHVRSTT